jgi:multimeric flavodoxin WrbA
MCNTIIDKMAEADGLILGSPVYYGQPAGNLLAYQQRMLFSGVKAFENKPAAVLCVCRRGGSSAAVRVKRLSMWRACRQCVPWPTTWLGS